MPIRLNKRSFTLLEILIVMLLISAALGALSLQIAKAIKKERFERGVEQVITKLMLAQELMLDYHCDACLTLRQQQSGILCTIQLNTPLPHHLERSINRYSHIKGIEGIIFDNLMKDEVVLCFEGSLGISPQGVLTLVYQDLNKNLLLKGYPAQIIKGCDEHQKEHKAIYPEEILSAF